MKTNIKMKVTPEQSKAIQEIVFANGGGWTGSSFQEVSYTDYKFLYINEEKEIECGEDADVFRVDYFEEVEADLFIKTNGTCEETEENKMEWTPYDGQDLEVNKDYLCSTKDGIINVATFVKNNMYWQNSIIAYAELPKPFKPKTLKERLDEAVNKYCYEFSEEEWADKDTLKHSLKYSYIQNEFVYYETIQHRLFSPFYFGSKTDVNEFINSFSTDELLQIMKGEVK